MKMLLTINLVLIYSPVLHANAHEHEQAAPQQETQVEQEREASAAPAEDEQASTAQQDIPLPEEHAVPSDDKKASADEPRPRFMLFIDTLKYRVTTHNVDASHGRGGNETNISSSSTTTTLQALDAIFGLKSYHDRLVLGFGIYGNLVSASDAVSGGVLMAGYQLLEGLELGGLLYISSREKTTSTHREDVIEGEHFSSEEESTHTDSIHSFGPWLKLQAGNYWQALFAVYYTSSQSKQKSDNGKQNGNARDNLTTSIERSYFALDLIFGPWIPLTDNLTFVPQINLTWYLPRNYTQTTTMSSSGSDTYARDEEKLEFDERASLDYSLVLGGLRYEF